MKFDFFDGLFFIWIAMMGISALLLIGATLGSLASWFIEDRTKKDKFQKFSAKMALIGACIFSVGFGGCVLILMGL